MIRQVKWDLHHLWRLRATIKERLLEALKILDESAAERLMEWMLAIYLI
jgi:hypothetical protein